MSKLEELQLLYYFGEFVIEYGYMLDTKEHRKKALKDFIGDTRENMDALDKDELPYFAQSSTNLVDADIYLAKFLGI